MNPRTPADAVRLFVGSRQRAMSTITRNVVIVGSAGYRPAGSPHEARLSSPAELPDGAGGAFQYWEFYNIVEDRTASDRRGVQTVSYEFALDDTAGHEVFAYHWHPVGESHVHMPHLHPGAGAEVSLPAIRDAHLPTGQVSVAAVIRLLIVSFSVRPLRRDWATILEPES